MWSLTQEGHNAPQNSFIKAVNVQNAYNYGLGSQFIQCQALYGLTCKYQYPVPTLTHCDLVTTYGNIDIGQH